MKSLSEAKRYVDSFARPTGYNTHAWSVAKKLAMEAWECYLESRQFNKPINYLCQEFYHMIRTPGGDYIVPQGSFRSLT